MPELKEKYHLDLNDKEAILVNTLYALMVAMSHGSDATVHRTILGLQTVICNMSGEEQVAMNVKMTTLTAGLDPEIMKQLGIERPMPFPEIKRRYAREEWEHGINDKRNT